MAALIWQILGLREWEREKQCADCDEAENNNEDARERRLCMAVAM
ncbi:hypothetical protein [Corynebacterium spheniscorum]|nr:hypothetical protein [Corynebacterium spheniscorum]